jgi:hypothetical protein
MRSFVVKRRPATVGAPLWIVEEGEEIHGDYLSEWAALLDAIDAAQDAGERGTPARVMVTEADGTARLRWTYARDPYPIEDVPHLLLEMV